MYIPEVLEGEARGRMRKLYHNIKATLHTPLVGDLFRTLAFYPAFLKYALECARPNLSSSAFEQAADALRRIEPPPSPPPPLPAYVTHRDLRGAAHVLPVFHDLNAKLLLLTTAWYEALSERPLLGRMHREEPFLPPGIPTCYPKSIPLLRIESAPPHVRDLLKSITDAHSLFTPPGEYRALALYPTFLTAAWQGVHPYLHTSWYRAERERLLNRARMLAHQLPHPLSLGATRLQQSLPEREVASCIALVAAYREVLPALMIDVELMTAMLRQPPQKYRYFS